jgi:hypothetical protein
MSLNKQFSPQCALYEKMYDSDRRSKPTGFRPSAEIDDALDLGLWRSQPKLMLNG